MLLTIAYLFPLSLALLDHSKHIDIYQYIEQLEQLSPSDMYDLIDEISAKITKSHDGFHEGETIDSRQFEQWYDQVLIARHLCHLRNRDMRCQPPGKFWHGDIDTRGESYNKEWIKYVQSIMSAYNRTKKKDL